MAENVGNLNVKLTLTAAQYRAEMRRTGQDTKAWHSQLKQSAQAIAGLGDETAKAMSKIQKGLTRDLQGKSLAELTALKRSAGEKVKVFGKFLAQAERGGASAADTQKLRRAFLGASVAREGIGQAINRIAPPTALAAGATPGGRPPRIPPQIGNAFAPMRGDLRAITGLLDGFNQSLLGTTTRIAALVGGISAVGLAAKGLKEGIGGFANIEQTQIAFEGMFQSAEKAKRLVSDLRSIAIESPLFTFAEFQTAARQMAGFGFTAEEIIPNLRRLADVAAGLGQPLGDVIYQFATARSEGRLMTRDINQLANLGLPVLKEIAAQFGIVGVDVEDTNRKVRKFVEEGNVGFSSLQKIVEDVTSANGKFFNFQTRQLEGLRGTWRQFAEQVTFLLIDLGGVIAKELDLKAVIARMQDFTASFQDKFLPAIRSAILFLKNWGLTILKTVIYISAIIAALKLAIGAYRLFSAASAIAQALSGPAGVASLLIGLAAAGVAIGVVNAAFDKLESAFDSTGQTAWFKEIKQEIADLEKDMGRAGESAKGMKDKFRAESEKGVAAPGTGAAEAAKAVAEERAVLQKELDQLDKDSIAKAKTRTWYGVSAEPYAEMEARRQRRFELQKQLSTPPTSYESALALSKKRRQIEASAKAIIASRAIAGFGGAPVLTPSGKDFKADALKTAIRETVEGLQNELATLEMSKTELSLYNLQKQGATKETLSYVSALSKEFDALKALSDISNLKDVDELLAGKKQLDFSRKRATMLGGVFAGIPGMWGATKPTLDMLDRVEKKSKKGAKEFGEGFETPLEKYRRELKKLEAIHGMFGGEFTKEQFDRGRLKLAEDLAKEFPAPETRLPPALMAGTPEAASAINRSIAERTGGDPTDIANRILAVERAQHEFQKKQLPAIERAIKEIGIGQAAF